MSCNNYNGIVSIEEFDAYTGNYESSPEAVRMKIDMLKSAQEIVESYLNYKLDSGLHVDMHIGFNNSKIYLDSRPVANVNLITINHEEFENYGFDYESIYRTDGLVFKDKDMILIEYETSGTFVPPLIKQTILRIAALLLQESNGNIGLTGKSATDGMSRSFINYTNFQKYLDPLSNYRVFKM